MDAFSLHTLNRLIRDWVVSVVKWAFSVQNAEGTPIRASLSLESPFTVPIVISATYTPTTGKQRTQSEEESIAT